MAVKPRVERPAQTINAQIGVLSQDVKLKVAEAIQSVVNAIKTKHL